MPHDSKLTSRRNFLTRYGGGTGLLGLSALLAGQFPASANAASKPPHFAPKAKRFIHLLMNGGPSHVDSFDPKPLLAKYEGQRPAAVNLRTQRKTTGILKSPFRFAQHGESGLWISELFPHVAQHADELCVLRSMHTDIPEHVSGLLMMDIGANQPNRPSMGSWITYGLGTENADLPGFIVLSHRGHPERPVERTTSNSPARHPCSRQLLPVGNTVAPRRASHRSRTACPSASRSVRPRGLEKWLVHLPLRQ